MTRFREGRSEPLADIRYAHRRLNLATVEIKVSSDSRSPLCFRRALRSPIARRSPVPRVNSRDVLHTRVRRRFP